MYAGTTKSLTQLGFGALVVGAWLAPALDARAAPRVLASEVKIDSPEVPFTAVELRAALAMRLPAGRGTDDRRPPSVVVSMGEGDAVRVEVGAGRHAVTVELEGDRGEDAARRVALVVGELLRGPPSVPVPPLPPPAAVARRAPPAPPRWRRLGVGVWTSLGAGTNLDRARWSASVEASYDLRPSLRALLSAGVALVPAGEVAPYAVTLTALPLRLGMSWLPGVGRSLALVASVLLQPYWVGGGTDHTSLSHAGALLALGAAARYGVPLSASLALRLAVGADVYLDRIDLQVGGRSALRSERVAVWGAAGLRYAR